MPQAERQTAPLFTYSARKPWGTASREEEGSASGGGFAVALTPVDARENVLRDDGQREIRFPSLETPQVSLYYVLVPA
jgi:hypothetical protein